MTVPSRRLGAVQRGVLTVAGCGGSATTAAGRTATSRSGTLRVSGSTTVNPVAADAAEVLRKQGRKITVDASGGSAGGIAQLGAGQVEVAMSSKPLRAADRAMFPGTDLVETQIGADAVGIVVRREVVEAGVTSITRDQARQLFEGRIRSWSELGGPDLDVFVYDKEPGRGTREVLDGWLYGKEGKAPPPPDSDTFAIVGGNEETRAKLLSTPGSTGPLSTSFVTAFPKLAVLAVDGVEPTPQSVRTGAYPLARPLSLITNGPPAGPARDFVDYVLGPEGQKLVTRHGFLTAAELGLR